MNAAFVIAMATLALGGALVITIALLCLAGRIRGNRG